MNRPKLGPRDAIEPAEVKANPSSGRRGSAAGDRGAGGRGASFAHQDYQLRRRFPAARADGSPVEADLLVIHRRAALESLRMRVNLDK